VVRRARPHRRRVQPRTPPQKSVVHQIGGFTKGGLPIIRERRAIADIYKANGDLYDIFFHDKTGKVAPLLNPQQLPGFYNNL